MFTCCRVTVLCSRCCSAQSEADRTAAEAKLEAAAVRLAAAQLKLLLAEVEAQQAVLATAYDAWTDRLNGMKTSEDLVGALRDIEQELNVLGDGLPRGKTHSPSVIPLAHKGSFLKNPPL